MESLIEQVRGRFYGPKEENKEESSSKREREKKRSQGWIRKRFSRQMSWDYNVSGTDYPAAVAAAAFAVQSQEESTSMDHKKPTFSDRKTTTSIKTEEAMPPKTAATGRTPTFPAPPPPPPAVRPVETRRSSRKPGAGETDADAWEKTEIARIKQRYQKLRMEIEKWENKKKKKARTKLERTQAELDKRRARVVQSYLKEMIRIDDIAKGASSQADKNRVKEENIVKSKANKIRSTGKVPVTCLCC